MFGRLMTALILAAFLLSGCGTYRGVGNVVLYKSCR